MRYLIGALLATLVFTAPAWAATFTVDTIVDDVDFTPGDGSCAIQTGECSLRAAIGEANALAGSDTIEFDADYTITLGSMLPSITTNLTITGTGAENTVINGAASYRCLYVNGGTVTISGVTITGGLASNGGGIFIDGGTVNVTNSTISGNSASGAGVNFGGGIYINGGTVNVINSTFSGNTGSNYGGGIYNSPGSTLTITNSTISGNTAANGGGVFNDDTVTIKNTTITKNTGSTAVGGVYNNGGTITLSNTIVADQTSGVDCFGGITSNDYNLGSDGSCVFAQAHDIDSSALANLGALANNGGSTNTHALQAGSAAIDKGDCSAGAVTTDQRGTARAQGSACDIGAYEVNQYAVSVTTSGSGSVADNGGLAGFSISCGATCSDYVVNGESVTLTATPGSGLNFGGWSGACSGTGNCVLSNIAAAKSVTATFAAPATIYYTLDVVINGSGTIVSSPAGISCPGTCSATFASGTAVTLTQSNNLSGWYDDCASQWRGEPCTLTMTTNHYVRAIYGSGSSSSGSGDNSSGGSSGGSTGGSTTPLGVITLISPENNSTTGSSVTFEWDAVDGVNDFQFTLCQNANLEGCSSEPVVSNAATAALAGFGAVMIFGFIGGARRRVMALAFALIFTAWMSGCGGDSSAKQTNVTKSVSGLAPGTYYWKVTATGYQSETRTFTVQ